MSAGPVPRLTIEQAVIVSGYTGMLCCSFGRLHAAIEDRIGRPVWTHEIPALQSAIATAFRADFLALCCPDTPMPDQEAGSV